MLLDDFSPIDERELRNTFGKFLSGVTIVSTRDQLGRDWGLTANSFTSVSLDPPLLLVCIGKHAGSFDAFNACKSFGVSVLAADQEDLSNHFAFQIEDKFSKISYRRGNSGVPFPSSCLAWFECTIENRVIAGDHLVLIGRVIDIGREENEPLGYLRGTYVRLDMATEGATHQLRDAKKSLGGAILENQDRILLVSDTTGGWIVPLTPLAFNGISLHTQVEAFFQECGYEAKIHCLYSVYSSNPEQEGFLIYRGHYASTVENSPNGAIKQVPLDQLPFEEIKEPGMRSMLRRYLVERSNSRFGNYTENHQGER